jgi:hypothetical protein
MDMNLPNPHQIGWLTGVNGAIPASANSPCRLPQGDSDNTLDQEGEA